MAASSGALPRPCTTSTPALSLARLTLARNTPGTAASALSTRATQLAQVMPSIRRRSVSVGTS